MKLWYDSINLNSHRLPAHFTLVLIQLLEIPSTFQVDKVSLKRPVKEPTMFLCPESNYMRYFTTRGVAVAPPQQVEN